MNNEQPLPQCALPSWNCKHKRVFLRADLNVPQHNGTIIDDYRLRSILPTIDAILQKEGSVILGTHIGRPKTYDPSQSTKIIAAWLEHNGYHVRHEADLHRARQLSYEIKNTILILENLRFFPGEKDQDHSFAQQLKELSDFYINDAFAVSHRNDTSVTLLPMLFEPSHRSIGPLMEHELKMLTPVAMHSAQPYVLILGGGKVHDKLPYIQKFLEKASSILLCPALSFTFAQAIGTSVGKSLVDESALKDTLKLIGLAQKNNKHLIIPIDYVVALNSFDGELITCDADAIPDNGYGISIGPRTTELYAQEIMKAHTVVFNAAMGFFHRPETLDATHHLLQTITNSSGYSILGGGESVAAVKRFKLSYGINFISTGGGAMLAYLCRETLPGLKPFTRY